ncbi:MAG: acetate kinase [bacterium]|nr:acetate kinase [bacterium]
MKTLVLNCGSSSIKYQFYQGEEVLAKGLAEQIGEGAGHLVYQTQGADLQRQNPLKDHHQALEEILALLVDPKVGVIKDRKDLDCVGHRVVHGGERFKQPVAIDSVVLQAIRACIPLAPLHNPANIEGIETAMVVFPRAKQIAVFDTAFHQSIPERAYRYALPEDHYKKLGVRRYGFHGTSHKYVAHRAAEFLGKPLEALKLITLHLGNGSSMAAIDRGQCIDTSMGMTPLEGLVMGTRCGDLDPAIPLFLSTHLGLDMKEVDQLLNKKAGFKGMTGHNDLRTIEAEYGEGNEAAIRALDLAAYRIKKYIGAYWAALGGLDALVFTAGIGENSVLTRKLALEGLEGLGIHLDPKLNAKPKGPAISTKASPVSVLVVPTNEELQIVREVGSLTKITL